MKETFRKLGVFAADAFSENGHPSSSRLLSIPHSLAVAFCLIFVSVKNHVVPDALTCGGLGAFATIHYMVNKGATVAQAFSSNPVTQVPPTPPEGH